MPRNGVTGDRPGKTYSQQAEIGDGGVTVVARAVNKMGHVWHDRRIDLGVDGTIELVDALSRQPLNRFVLVQIKASRRQFPGEDDEEFHYLCTADDMAYWSRAVNPVVIVCVHPDTDEAWWAPVSRARWVGEGRSLRIRFSKSGDRFDESAARKLIGLAFPTGAPPQIDAVRGHEKLLSNLLPIVRYPTTIWAAPALVTDPKELRRKLFEKDTPYSAWILRDKTAFSFQRPQESPLGPFVDTPETMETDEWALSKDSDLMYRFIDLLRQTVRELNYRELRYEHKNRYLYFRPTHDLSTRRVRPQRSGRSREVFKAYPKRHEPEEIRFCRHMALDLGFVRLGEVWYATLTPTYHFTHDGRRRIPWGGDYLAEMKRLERNDAVRGLVRFWANYLTRDPGLFDEESRMIQFGELLTVEADEGIDDRAWKALRRSELAKQPELWDQE